MLQSGPVMIHTFYSWEFWIIEHFSELLSSMSSLFLSLCATSSQFSFTRVYNYSANSCWVLTKCQALFVSYEYSSEQQNTKKVLAWMESAVRETWQTGNKGIKINVHTCYEIVRCGMCYVGIKKRLIWEKVSERGVWL